MKLFKLILLFAVILFNASVYGAKNASYIFNLSIDENIKDLSGNGNNPDSNLDESSWIKGKIESVRLKQKNYIKIPFKAFNSNTGAIELTVSPDDCQAFQTLFRVYSPKGDGLSLAIRKGKLQFAYYNRKAKKWYNVKCPTSKLRLNNWNNITCTWNLQKSLKLYINGECYANAEVNSQTNFKPESIITLGTAHNIKSHFKGKIRSFTLYDNYKINVKPDLNINEKRGEKKLSFKHGDFIIEFDKDDFTILSMRNDRVETVSKKMISALWTLNILNKKEKSNFTINSLTNAELESSISKNKLILIWKNISIPKRKETFTVKVIVTATGKSTLNWTINVSPLPENYALNKVAFPVIPYRRTTKNPEDMFLAYPYYWGRLLVDPFFIGIGQNSRVGNAYPGGAHFQFSFLYGKDMPGVYTVAQDGEGHFKDFLWDAHPKLETLIFSLNQTPEQKKISRQFKQAYPVHIAIMNGDWYDAAKRYRKWALKQKWCSQGPLHSNKNVPEWYKNIDVTVRLRTTKAQQLTTNISNLKLLLNKLQVPAMGIWYQYNHSDSNDSVGKKINFGCGVMNARKENITMKGVKEAVKSLNPKNARIIGYINSRIYDQSLNKDHAETNKVKPHVMRELDGSFGLYAKSLYDVCRADKWWQEHLFRIIDSDIKNNGFSGMYLDSFGRGQYSCYAHNHGHLAGSSTASIKGQRTFGKMLKTRLRKTNPECILSAEACIEQFIDIIDAKLHHYNIFTECIPIWQTVYHDYQISYGRTMSQTRIKLASLLHIGAQFGRYFMSPPESTFEKLYFSDTLLKYTQEMLLFRKKFRKYFTFGEMLRQVKITGAGKPVMTKVKKFMVKVPNIFSSSWKDKNGSVAIFLTNISDKNKAITIEFDPDEYGVKNIKPRLWQQKKGELKPSLFNANKLTLPPLTTVGIEYKK